MINNPFRGHFIEVTAINLLTGRPLPGRGDLLSGEGAGEAGGAAGPGSSNQRGVSESYSSRGRAVI